jgi:hypothetical protein
MSDSNSVIEDETVVQDDAQNDVQDELPAGDAVNDETVAADTPSEEPASDDEEVVITIGEEQPTPEEEEVARAPAWVKELRKQNREKDRALRERDAEIARLKGSPAQPEAEAIGPKPTLASCEYDEDEFERKLSAWHDKNRSISEAKAAKDAEAKKAQEAWQAKLAEFNKAKTAIKVKDFEEAEANLTDAFSSVQQGILIDGADNAAVLTYALGKNPKKLKELASITNPVKFAFAVAKLETQLKVTPRKTAPVPDRVVRGNASVVPGSVDPMLKKLQEQADRTGDRSAVAKYIREQARKAA